MLPSFELLSEFFCFHDRLVEDADLWRWTVEWSREFHSGLLALELEFDVRKNPAIFDFLKVNFDAAGGGCKVGADQGSKGSSSTVLHALMHRAFALLT